MTDNLAVSYRGYENPLDLVDRTELPYDDRLALLQEWKAEAAKAGQSQERQDEILAAIHALEMGAEVQNDVPDETPDQHGYGKGHKRT